MVSRFVIMPPRLLAVMLASAALVHWGFDFPSTIVRAPVLGAVLVAVGLAVNVWAARLFDAARTPIRPDATPSALVEQGPFRWSRNPMYAGLVVLLVGVALLVGSVPFWVVPVVYASTLRISFIPHEERALRERFGAAYEDYARRVGRWIGRRASARPREASTEGRR